MNELQNAMTVTAQRAGEVSETARIAIVDAYDPATFSVKVRVQPSNVLSGWIPVASCFVGNGWGMLAAPSIGDMVRVDFQEGDLNAGVMGAGFFNDIDRPPSVQAGEFLLKHASGSLLKFNNDGTVSLVSAGALNTSAPVWNHAGPVNIVGDLKVTGDITDRSGTQSRTVAGLRTIYNTHTHVGSSAIPNQTA
jgi:phage baseplate assembly protein gpV